MSSVEPVAAGTRVIDRRRMWGAAALVLALAGALVAWFGWGNGAPAKITCVGFETAAEDRSSTYAVMKVSNRSGRSLSLLTPKPETWEWQFSPPSPGDAELRLSDGNINL